VINIPSVLKNVPQMHIINNNDKKDNSRIVNILTDNSGAYFSITMTVYSGHSIANDNYKLLNSHIIEVDEPECSPKVPESSGKKTDKLQFIFAPENIANHPDYNNCCSIEDDGFLKQLMENKNIDIGNLEKLKTLELTKEEMNMIEKFFKEKQINFQSIGPIENIED
jgi:hypothetical protein